MTSDEKPEKPGTMVWDAAAEAELDRQLDPDLHDAETDAKIARGEMAGTMTDIARVLIRSIRAMSEFDRALLKARLLGKTGPETNTVQ